MIVVMGATGRVGSAILERVRGGQTPVRALCRRPPTEPNAGVEWRPVDALDTGALTAAFEGAQSVFVMNVPPPDAADVYEQGAATSRSIAGALTTARVPHAVALSSQGAQRAAGTGVVSILHGFEKSLGSTETRLTLLRPAYFLDSWIVLAQAALTTGRLPSFIHPSSLAIDAVAARDVGEVAACHLLSRETGVVNIVGPQRYSDDDAALLASQLTGRSIVAEVVPQAAIAPAHEAVGLGPSTAAAIAELYAAISSSAIPFEAADATVRGRTTLRDLLAPVLSPA